MSLREGSDEFLYKNILGHWTMCNSKKGCVEETVGDRRREENGDMDWRNNGGSTRSSITSDNIRHFNKFLLKQIHFSNELSQRKFLKCCF